MKGKAIIPLVLGLAVGVLAVKFVIDTVKKAKSENQAAPTFQVVRARQDIDAYQLITDSMLEIIETSDENFAPEKSRFAAMEDLKDRVTAKTIPMHVPVLETMLAPKGTQQGMVGRIPPGFRAVSVRIDEVTGVAYQLNPGDWVDVVVVMDVDSSSGNRQKETVSEVVLQRVQVAAVGRGSQSEQDAAATKGKPAKSATLFIHEKNVPKFHLASSRGRITLSMRGKDDGVAKAGGLPSAKLSELFNNMFGKKPVIARAVIDTEPYEVVIYRGSGVPGKEVDTERVVFQNRYSSNIIKVSKGSSARASKQIKRNSGYGFPSSTTGKQSTSSVVKFRENADNKKSEIGAQNNVGGL